MNVKIFTRSAVAIAIAAALSAGYVAGRRDMPAPQVISPAEAAALMPAEAAAKTGIPDFSGLVETYGPAVVNISAKHVVKQVSRRASPQQLPIDPSDPFYQFFKHFYGGMPGMQGPDGGDQSDRPSASLGSGFIISADGYILTNAHVVDGANVVTVKLTDKREYRAKVVGADKQSDVAVLKIDAKDLPTVKIGDPRQSKVGQWVVAIGSPYGFDNTVTSGIISAKSRSLPDENYTPFIQTDVPVNPGNSGGPLFNLQGEVIGINSMIYSQTGGFQGLSFAIPINEAIKVKDDLVKTGHVSRGRLGVAVQSVNQTLADSFGMQKPQGALVSSVDPGGPAAKAGLQPGDVILSVNGQPVDDSTMLPSLIAGIKPGSKADLQVWRDKASKTVGVTIGTLGDTKVASNDTPQSDVQGRLGVAVRPLTPEEMNGSSLTHGLVVAQVGGAAASAGIQAGDVILAVNGRPVSNAQQLKQMVAQAGNSIALLIQRDDAQIFVPVDLG
ncbi:DegQ family serine endoprotease [Paraburkholderia caballeronis]|uniref:Probable periplasmic serine endoprotease DegP-like n=1 Tax=Paraburkholderia caballeronis TaxID=416943 RepID=A0A1H7PRG8_9BURK|nr:DegQ family serine endoprotease [Paraburkholderia caballeronis]PXW24309.1 serine protease Do [Paraburkholderia caballeronis]PXX00091.1 serine protease Do [Paraburkholderia caballeronis]RAJ97220.1 serine protease Do [Paraburkholderia caballeronis]TDV08358.1 serine protease Do [Paraburkholderia caballeronis]TDV12050.1 serine protease Do [Paraburkholderia caballeronis]